MTVRTTIDGLDRSGCGSLVQIHEIVIVLQLHRNSFQLPIEIADDGRSRRIQGLSEVLLEIQGVPVMVLEVEYAYRRMADRLPNARR